MGDAKVTLSAEEMRLATDPAVILTKNSVMAKAVELMAGLSEGYREILEGAAAGAAGAASRALPGEADQWSAAAATPKISRGENYLGLPWGRLDYPRSFGREDVFAIRTLFWWGHAFSVTLHLKGKYKTLYLPVIEQKWKTLSDAGFHAGVSADEWRHEHTPDNYGVLTGPEALRGPGDFLKLSAAVGLHRWGNAEELLTGVFKTLIGVLF